MSEVAQKIAAVFQENLGNRITPALGNGMVGEITNILKETDKTSLVEEVIAKIEKDKNDNNTPADTESQK